MPSSARCICPVAGRAHTASAAGRLYRRVTWISSPGRSVADDGQPRRRRGVQCLTTMKYSRLGDTGLIVSRLSLGSMTFGPGEGKGTAAAVYKVDQAGADRLVGQALDAGVNHFNSADAYAGGQSEVML